jgi:CBS domain containing-hemolysin-like protein
LSKIVIYRGDIDNVVGYVHSRDLFKRPDKLTSILHSTFVIPEPMPADEVLRQFIRRRKHLAVVVDEFGGTSGILTMEDIVEQIIGDIEDEHDVEVLLEEQVEPGVWRFSARLDVETVNERYDLHLPLNDAYETLGGLVLHQTETIPTPGLTLSLADTIIEVEQVESNRIEIIRIHLPEEES